MIKIVHYFSSTMYATRNTNTSDRWLCSVVVHVYERMWPTTKRHLNMRATRPRFTNDLRNLATQLQVKTTSPHNNYEWLLSRHGCKVPSNLRHRWLRSNPLLRQTHWWLHCVCWSLTELLRETLRALWPQRSWLAPRHGIVLRSLLV